MLLCLVAVVVVMVMVVLDGDGALKQTKNFVVCLIWVLYQF